MLLETCSGVFGKNLTANLLRAVSQVLYKLNPYEISPRMNL